MFALLSRDVLPAMLSPGDRVLAAVSGGPDSVALAHMLWRYVTAGAGRDAAGRRLVLSHVNHGVRPEAETEETLVRELGRRLGAPVLVRRFDAKAYARERGLSFQAAAREWRYACWREDMAAEGCTLIATAHHRDDQAETVLYRLLRGSGATGLAGIWPERDGIIRPLLGVSKEDLLAYCAAENLPYAVDASNLTAAYDRNRIRLELLPFLREKYNGRIDMALGQTAAALRRDEEYFAGVIAEKWMRYAVAAAGSVRLALEAWREPPAVLTRLLRRAASEASAAERGLTFAQAELLRREGARPGWRQNLPGLTVWTERDALVLAADHGEAAPLHAAGPDPVTARRGEWQTLFWGRAGLWPDCPEGFSPAEAEEGSGATWQGRRVARFSAAALNALPDPIVWRCRRGGDLCRQPGGWHKSLKNVFQERGAPAARRSLWPLLASGPEILWLPGLALFPAWQPASGEEALFACLDF
jgi:tRNA(Ile)-lysidine synthase